MNQLILRHFLEDMVSKYYSELQPIDYKKPRDLYMAKLNGEATIIKLGLYIQSIHHYQHAFDGISINNNIQKEIWVKGLYFDEDFSFIRYRHINGQWLQLPDISFRRDALEKERDLQAKENSKSRKEYGHIYFLLDEESRDGGGALIKIGKAKNIQNRIRTLRGANPRPLKLLGSIATYYPSREEKKIHKRFSAYRTKGEWFKLPTSEINKLKDKCNLIG